MLDATGVVGRASSSNCDCFERLTWMFACVVLGLRRLRILDRDRPFNDM